MARRIRDTNELRKKNALKILFKKVVRGVILNRQWLDDQSEDHKFTSNAKRNIALLVRRKRKVGLLTLAEKSLIRTPHAARTVEDRKKLCVLFGGLVCFSRIPPKIRARLVPFVQFMSVMPGRTIVKQCDLPIIVFYILTGEVEMSKRVYNYASNKYDMKVDAICGPGDCVGDVEMVENCHRTHTFTTRSQCELLVLFENDFTSILKKFMLKLWDQKKKALKALDYFDFLDEQQIISACRFSSLRQYLPLETIYYEDKGTLTNVHFVLSGECVILQRLSMKVKDNNGTKTFQLIDMSGDEKLLIDEASNEFKNKNINNLMDGSRLLDSEKKKMIRNIGLKEIEKACQTYSRTEPEIKSRQSKRRKLDLDQDECLYQESLKVEGGDEFEDQFWSSSSGNISNLHKLRKNDLCTESHMTFDNDTDEYETDEYEIRTVSTVQRNENRFIDVGSLTFGGIFGLGEKIEHRVIMARTIVQCLTLPRFWLLEKEQNPGNIWQRRLFYLECTIPSREALFDDFLRSLKWKKFKYKYIQSILGTQLSGVTTNNDIPIICRIVESSNDD